MKKGRAIYGAKGFLVERNRKDIELAVRVVQVHKLRGLQDRKGGRGKLGGLGSNSHSRLLPSVDLGPAFALFT